MHKNLKLLIGFIFVFIGAGCLLRLAGIDVISFSGFTHALNIIWPLILVVCGIFFITDRRIIRNISIIAFVVILCAGTVYNSMTIDRDIFNYNGGVFDRGDSDNDMDDFNQFRTFDFFDF